MQLPRNLSTRKNRGAHDHFWDRAVSRRSFMRGSAAVTGLAMSTRLGLIGRAAAAPANAVPNPIPGGFNLSDFGGPDLFLHVTPPAAGSELITITDFNGAIGAAEIQGLGTDNNGATKAFDVDMRFMQGEFVGADGRHAHATFGFI
jgi:hypothetical protein